MEKVIGLVVGLVYLVITTGQSQEPTKELNSNRKNRYYKYYDSIEQALKNKEAVGRLGVRLVEIENLDSLYLFPNLKALYLRNARDTAIFLPLPLSVFELDKLEILHTGEYTVSFPKALPTSSKIIYLACQLPDTATQSSIHQLKQLEFLSLTYKGKAPLPINLSLLSSLRNLEFLVEDLEWLPTDLVKLTNLRLLSIQNKGTTPLKLPNQFYQLQKLRILHLPLVEELPTDFEKLEYLEQLNITVAGDSIDKILHQLAKLPKLTKLNITLQDTGHFHCPTVFPQLKELHLSSFHLESFRCSIPHLQKLSLNSSQMETIPKGGFEHQGLENLDLSFCLSLKNLPSAIEQFKDLKELNLRGTSIMNLEAIDFSQLPQLRILDLMYTYLPEGTLHKIKQQVHKDCTFGTP